jgi:hypothetical protein
MWCNSFNLGRSFSFKTRQHTREQKETCKPRKWRNGSTTPSLSFGCHELNCSFKMNDSYQSHYISYNTENINFDLMLLRLIFILQSGGWLFCCLNTHSFSTLIKIIDFMHLVLTFYGPYWISIKQSLLYKGHALLVAQISHSSWCL